jgi:hypothetical protein
LSYCFKGIKFASVPVLLTVTNWPPWSDRPLTIEDAENELNLEPSTQLLSTAVLESFGIHVAKFIVDDRLYI